FFQIAICFMRAKDGHERADGKRLRELFSILSSIFSGERSLTPVWFLYHSGRNRSSLRGGVFSRAWAV
ncbi:hypothetical protein, partial [Bacillus cereus]|uniref:hypothetical protein n=1 Tax=Bacillus cereus TaxID=1396 RepID=UPI001C2D530D